MNANKHSIAFLKSCLAALILLSACAEDEIDDPVDPIETPTPPKPRLSIKSFVPSQGTFGTSVTLTGDSFAASPLTNEVTFLGESGTRISATVIAVTSNSIQVTVPTGAFSGKIEVRVGNSTALSSAQFIRLPTVTTLAGGGSGLGSLVDGTGENARFFLPVDVLIDQNGDLIVVDQLNHAVRRVTQQGVVSTIAGDGSQGYSEGSGASVRFYYPGGIAPLATGEWLVSDQGNHAIRRVKTTGEVSTFAGGPSAIVPLFLPNKITRRTDGSYLIGGYGRIQTMSASGIVNNFVGTGDYNSMGLVDGPHNIATVASVRGIGVLPNGNIIYLDLLGNSTRIINSTSVSTVTIYGVGGASLFALPQHLVVLPDGSILITSEGGSQLKRINLSGEVSVVAGKDTYIGGFADGLATTALFSTPVGFAVAPSGKIFICDSENNRIRVYWP